MEVLVEAPADSLDGAHIAELDGIIFGGFQRVEGLNSFLPEIDGVQAEIVDDPQEFISLVVVHEELVKLRIIVVAPDHCLDSAEPAFFISIEFRREILLHMVFEKGKPTLIP